MKLCDGFIYDNTAIDSRFRLFRLTVSQFKLRKYFLLLLLLIRITLAYRREPRRVYLRSISVYPFCTGLAGFHP